MWYNIYRTNEMYLLFYKPEEKPIPLCNDIDNNESGCKYDFVIYIELEIWTN